ncbi:MAG: hypothetical protein KC649_07470, partial [Candidatus Omnitrophica bacterium]|nr:hypothetical protein [Candidatus Omnitrophota bacterium]
GPAVTDITSPSAITKENFDVTFKTDGAADSQTVDITSNKEGIALADMKHGDVLTFDITRVDALGNETKFTVSVTIDIQGPVLALISAPTQATTDTLEAVISSDGVESTVSFKFTDLTGIDSINDLVPGQSYTFRYTVNDSLGNASNEITFDVKWNASSQSIDLITVPDSSYQNNFEVTYKIGDSEKTVTMNFSDLNGIGNAADLTHRGSYTFTINDVDDLGIPISATFDIMWIDYGVTQASVNPDLTQASLKIALDNATADDLTAYADKVFIQIRKKGDSDWGDASKMYQDAAGSKYFSQTAADLVPGTEYEYRVIVNNEQEFISQSLEFQTDAYFIDSSDINPSAVAGWDDVKFKAELTGLDSTELSKISKDHRVFIRWRKKGETDWIKEVSMYIEKPSNKAVYVNSASNLDPETEYEYQVVVKHKTKDIEIAGPMSE